MPKGCDLMLRDKDQWLLEFDFLISEIWEHFSPSLIAKLEFLDSRAYLTC